MKGKGINMTKFDFNGHTINMYNFAKHHKEIGLMIGRTKVDGSYENLIANKDFQKAVDKATPEMFKEAQKNFGNLSKGERYLSTVRYAILKNIEFKERHIEGYEMIGSSNTHSQYSVLYSFLFDEGDSLYKAHIERIMNVSGSYAMKFHDTLSTDLKDVIEEIIKEADGTEFHDLGIGYSEDGKEIYRLVVVDEYADTTTIDISLEDLERALYSVKVIECTTEIVDLED